MSRVKPASVGISPITILFPVVLDNVVELSELSVPITPDASWLISVTKSLNLFE